MTLMAMAESYRAGGDLIRLRIAALKEAQREAAPTEWMLLEQRIRDLGVLYREVRETALVLERYYEGRGKAHDR